jgi:hypothetical protein
MNTLIILLLSLFTNSVFAFNYSYKHRIVIIDSGLNNFTDHKNKLCPEGHMDFTGEGNFDDSSQHGSNVFSIASKYAHSDVCFIILKVVPSGKRQIPLGMYMKALIHAYHLPNVLLVNLSLSSNQRVEDEFTMLKGLLSKGVVLSMAAGNNGANMDVKCNYYPVCFFKKNGWYKHPHVR